jgi:hypothetical protein
MELARWAELRDDNATKFGPHLAHLYAEFLKFTMDHLRDGAAEVFDLPELASVTGHVEYSRVYVREGD